jgi:hypothetical protein
MKNRMTGNRSKRNFIAAIIAQSARAGRAAAPAGV